MKLINSVTSAFGRKIAIALKEKDIPFEMVWDIPWNDQTIVPQYSPLEQLPILVTDDGEHVYDSMYIVDWLERRYPNPPLLPADTDAALAAMRLQKLGERLAEILVLAAFEEVREHPSDEWIARQQRKFKGGLAEMARLVGDRAPATTDPIHYGDIAAAVALVWFDFMPTHGILASVEEAKWRDKYPNLVTFLDALQLRPSFRQTQPEMMDMDVPAVVA